VKPKCKGGLEMTLMMSPYFSMYAVDMSPYYTMAIGLIIQPFQRTNLIDCALVDYRD
jgi:hypothetical protein